jgi:hypothetical protein
VRAPSPPNRWLHLSAAVSFPCTLSFPLSLPLPSGARLSASVACSPARPSSVSASRARFVSAMNRFLHALATPRCAVGPPCQFCPPREPSWTSAHARRGPQPCRLPMHPSSLLSTANTRTRSPASFRASSPSLALCSRRSASPEFRARRAHRPARQKQHQVTSSSIPRSDIHSRA